jgi:hypothetical protein
MKGQLSLDKLLYLWFWHRHWKINHGVLLEATHRQMYGQMIGLFGHDGSMIAIYAPLKIDRPHTYAKKQPLFKSNINSPEFFPKLDVFLKSIIKLHRKKRIS